MQSVFRHSKVGQSNNVDCVLCFTSLAVAWTGQFVVKLIRRESKAVLSSFQNCRCGISKIKLVNCDSVHILSKMALNIADLWCLKAFLGTNRLPSIIY